MVVNINLDKDNKIIDINQENSIAVEIETPELIHFGISQYINGVFYENKEKYDAQQEMFRIKLEGNKVGLVYAERYRSELGNYLIEKYDDLDYIILINISQRISYRGKDRVDLSIISKKYGGGGHKNAAGSPLPSDILKQITELIYKNVEWL